MAEENLARETSDATRLVADPVVSILMITYNHADFLADAIKSVVAQHCEFPYELIIGEDASSDETLAIALAYQRKYPNIIRVITADTNVGMTANNRRIFALARGEFVAYCEGDDYWCRPDKLARQVAVIRSDTRIGIVHADWVRAKFDKGTWQHDPLKSVHCRVQSHLLQGDLSSTWHFPKILRTCTIVMRREIMRQLLDSDLARREYKFGDNVRNVFTALQWRVGYVPIVAAVYRTSSNSALRSGTPARVAYYKSCLQFDDDARAYFAGKTLYDDGFRWEAGMSLLLWSLRALDASSALAAVRDLRRHFSLFRFLAESWRAVSMRWPTLRRQPRELPDVAYTPTMDEARK